MDKQSNNRNIIFLDIDGVLWSKEFQQNNPDARITENDPAAMARVKKLAQTAMGGGGANIVISSSWRLDGDLEGTKHGLKNSGADDDLLDMIIGQTPDLHKVEARYGHNRQVRGREIAAWLANHPEVRNYVIIDDLDPDEFLPEQRLHLAQTSIQQGFTDREYKIAANILNT